MTHLKEQQPDSSLHDGMIHHIVYEYNGKQKYKCKVYLLRNVVLHNYKEVIIDIKAEIYQYNGIAQYKTCCTQDQLNELKNKIYQYK